MRDDVSARPQAASVLATEMRAFANRRRGGLSRAFLERVSETTVESSGGVYVGTSRVYRADVPRLARVASRIVKGLFFHETGRSVSLGEVAIAMLEPSMRPREDAIRNRSFDRAFARDRSVLQRLRPHEIGRGIFSYRYLLREGAATSSHWLLEFYEAVRFIVETTAESNVDTRRFATFRQYTFP